MDYLTRNFPVTEVFAIMQTMSKEELVVIDELTDAFAYLTFEEETPMADITTKVITVEQYVTMFYNGFNHGIRDGITKKEVYFNSMRACITRFNSIDDEASLKKVMGYV
jgi:hypothetical protein